MRSLILTICFLGLSTLGSQNLLGQVYCDEAQTEPGFPSDPECEAVICAQDAFCCTDSWDGICASSAALEPACVGCLTNSDHSVVSGLLFIDYLCDGDFNGDDAPISGAPMFSGTNVLGETEADGTFSFWLDPDTLHAFGPGQLAAFDPLAPQNIETPDSSVVFDGVLVGLCPVAGAVDLSVELNTPGVNVLNGMTVELASEFEVTVCVENLSGVTAAGSLVVTFDTDAFPPIDWGAGNLGDGEITWDFEDVPPFGEACFNFQVATSITNIIGETYSFSFEASEDMDGFTDVTLENNAQQLDVFIEPASNIGSGLFCDQVQLEPGFPADPNCEAAVCAQDSFCCDAQWDGLCASQASSLVECYNCLMSSNASTISGTVFLDVNCNEQLDPDEELAPGVPIYANGVLIAISNSLGEYLGLFPNGDTTLISSIQSPGVNTNSHLLYTDTNQVFTDYNIGICAQGQFVNLGVQISPSGLPPRPGFPVSYLVCVQNEGTITTGAELTYDIGNMEGVEIIDPDGGEVVGDEIHWTIPELSFLEEVCFEIELLVVQGTDPGTILFGFASVESTDEGLVDIEHENDTDTYPDEVVAAFDPNDKTVDYPIVNFTDQVGPQGASLEYLIRFQNTGNFFATNVRVEDMLPPELNINSIETLHATHDYEMVIHPNNMVEWVFENIMLPDSTSNEPESHGHIHFRINTVPDVSLEDVISNQASIFFDFKEPVVTEPAVTTFMDCSEGSLDVLGLETVCAGETLTLSANRLDFEGYTWTVNGEQWEGSEIQLTAPNSTTLVTLTATHSVCELSTTATIEVAEVPEVEIVLEEGLLVTDATGNSYEWYLDGEPLDGADSYFIVPAENGLYEVVITYANGCTASNGLNFQSVGLEGFGENEVLLVPNPARDVTQLLLPQGEWHVSLLNLSGQVVRMHENVVTDNLTLVLEGLAPGMYIVQVQSPEKRVVEKLVVE